VPTSVPRLRGVTSAWAREGFAAQRNAGPTAAINLNSLIIEGGGLGNVGVVSANHHQLGGAGFASHG